MAETGATAGSVAIREGHGDHSDRPITLRSVDRALAGRYSSYVEEVERLVRAGVEVMRTHDRSDPRVSDIVAVAGLSNQAFYRHFKSKDELLLAILDDGLRQLVGYLDHQMAKEATGLGKVRRWVEGILAQAADPDAAEATRAVMRNTARVTEAFPEDARRSGEQIKVPLVTALNLAVEQGELSEVDEERDAEAAYRVVMASMHAALDARRPPSRRDVTHLVGFVIGGLGGGTRRWNGS